MAIRLAHRGYGKTGTADAVLEAVRLGHGAEFDLRTVRGSLIISHDIIATMTSDWRIERESFRRVVSETCSMALRGEIPTLPTFAINVKESGLGELIKRDLEPYSNYFIFDAAAPDAMEMRAMGLKVLGRTSDREPTPYSTEFDGIVLDEFEPWINEAMILNYQNLFGKVAIIGRALRSPGAEEPPWFEGADYLITDIPARSKA